jgi:hypothetical protein
MPITSQMCFQEISGYFNNPTNQQCLQHQTQIWGPKVMIINEMQVRWRHVSVMLEMRRRAVTGLIQHVGEDLLEFGMFCLDGVKPLSRGGF